MKSTFYALEAGFFCIIYKFSVVCRFVHIQNNLPPCVFARNWTNQIRVDGNDEFFDVWLLCLLRSLLGRFDSSTAEIPTCSHIVLYDSR